MAAARKMWAISVGVYSSYRVLCLLSTKKEADELLRRMKASKWPTYGSARVELFPVVRSDVKQVKVLSLAQEIWDNGTFDAPREQIRVEWPFDRYDPEVKAASWRWVRAPMYHNRGGRLEVSGTDFAAVREMFAHKRAEILAAQKGTV